MKKLFITTALISTIFMSAHVHAGAILREGSSGAAVSSVQKTLQSQGYFNHTVTGYYGTITKNAVMNFQKNQKISADGIVGYQTQRELYKSTCADKYNSNDVFWLSRLIEAEAKGENYTGKVAVGNCVVNRVRSADFPSTIEGVIFDTNFGVQYQPIANGTIFNTPSSDSVKAAQAALLGANPIGKCLYFFNPKTSTSRWIANNRVYYSTIGNHVFYL